MRAGRTKDLANENLRTTFGASLILHVLFLFTAIKVGSSLAVAEPKPIEVELGIQTEVAQQTDANRETAPLRREQPSVSRPDADIRETKRAAATAEPVSVAPARENTVKAEPEAKHVAPPTVAFALQESTPSRRPDGNTAAQPAPTGSENGNAARAPVVSPFSSEGGNATRPATNSAVGMQPYVIKGPPPAYPRDARSKGLTGKVRVKVLISERGTVEDAVIAQSSGHVSLDDAARQGLHRWLFSPAYRDGRAVAAWVVVPVVFKLE